jgi:hypothetical protein
LKDDTNDAFGRFEALARGIVNVPHAEVKKKLDKEKQKRLKRKTTKKVSSRAANGSI